MLTARPMSILLDWAWVKKMSQSTTLLTQTSSECNNGPESLPPPDFQSYGESDSLAALRAESASEVNLQLNFYFSGNSINHRVDAEHPEEKTRRHFLHTNDPVSPKTVGRVIFSQNSSIMLLWNQTYNYVYSPLYLTWTYQEHWEPVGHVEMYELYMIKSLIRMKT